MSKSKDIIKCTKHNVHVQKASEAIMLFAAGAGATMTLVCVKEKDTPFAAFFGVTSAICATAAITLMNQDTEVLDHFAERGLYTCLSAKEREELEND